MKTTLGVVAFLITSAGALSAYASTVWSRPAQYDNGVNPAITRSYYSTIEVHQAQTTVGPLWIHTTGQTFLTLQGPAPDTWQQFDNGINPSVAANFNSFVEVHQGQSGVGPLWFHAGTINQDGTVSFSPGGAAVYDTGVNPSVASSYSSLVEVHQAQSGVGPLWFHTGTLGTNGTASWNPAGPGTWASYDNGVNPSVAVIGNTVVEVHQAQDGVGALWIHTGTLHSDGTVNWSAGTWQAYDTGVNPSVGVAEDAYGNPIAFEVHQAGTGVGPLWTNVWSVNADSTLTRQGTAWQYDVGVSPAAGYAGFEVHQAGTGAGPLWTEQFAF